MTAEIESWMTGVALAMSLALLCCVDWFSPFFLCLVAQLLP